MESLNVISESFGDSPTFFASRFNMKCMVIFAPSKTVFDSGFHTMDSGLQVLDSGFFVGGTWILDPNHKCDPESLSCIPDSKPQNSGFHKKLMSRILHSSSSKCLLDSGIRIPSHGVIIFSEISEVTRATFTHCV